MSRVFTTIEISDDPIEGHIRFNPGFVKSTLFDRTTELA
tara:strand:- start:65 stop:181 length:117 start_codon:yes stop_codon:yes gene_type:complete